MRRKITETIREWDESGRATTLMILGSRQVGKTYSVTEYGRRIYAEQFLHVNFADRPDAASAFNDGLDADSVIGGLSVVYRHFRFVPGRTMIFFDEIQECPNARAALKSLASDGRYRIVASGSLLGLRIREVRLLPMGYVESVLMHPMDFEEFLWAMNVDPKVIEEVRASISSCESVKDAYYQAFSKMYSRYMVIGGMPAAVKVYAETNMVTDVHAIHEGIFNGYLDDISKYADDSVKLLAASCLRSIPAMLASENRKFMYSKVEVPRNGSGVKRTGFLYYAPALEWLSSASITMSCINITEPCSPLEERVRSNIFKLYLLDCGILTSRYDDSVFTDCFFGDQSVNSGAIGENAIAQALFAQGRRLMYFSKDDPRMEVDFVTVVGGRVCAIEVKTGASRNRRSLNRVMKEYGTDGIMFETRNCFVDEKGVRHYPLFAASFMDAIDPRDRVKDDLSFLDGILVADDAESM